MPEKKNSDNPSFYSGYLSHPVAHIFFKNNILGDFKSRDAYFFISGSVLYL
jgi:hypothetical protein